MSATLSLPTTGAYAARGGYKDQSIDVPLGIATSSEHRPCSVCAQQRRYALPGTPSLKPSPVSHRLATLSVPGSLASTLRHTSICST